MAGTSHSEPSPPSGDRSPVRTASANGAVTSTVVAKPVAAQAIGQVEAEAPEHLGVVLVELGHRRLDRGALLHGHLEVHAAARRQRAGDAGQRPVGVGHVLEHVGGQEHVDRAGRQVDVLEVEADRAAGATTGRSRWRCR